MKKIWADKTYLYVFYKRQSSFVMVTYTGGGGGYASKHYYYKKIKRTALAENFEINLSGGIEAGNLKYVDEDFRLEEGDASHPGKRYVTNRSGRIEIPCDENELSGEDRAVSRVGDRLFYCGNVIPVTGAEIRKIPDKIAEKLKASLEAAPPGCKCTHNLEFSPSGREGIILVRVIDKSHYLELDADSFEIRAEGRFPIRQKFSSREGEYSERGFVFSDLRLNQDGLVERRDDGGGIWLCDSEGCRKIGVPDYYRSVFAGAGNKVYGLVSPIGHGYYGSPLLKVKLLDVEAKTSPASQ